MFPHLSCVLQGKCSNFHHPRDPHSRDGQRQTLILCYMDNLPKMSLPRISYLFSKLKYKFNPFPPRQVAASATTASVPYAQGKRQFFLCLNDKISMKKISFQGIFTAGPAMPEAKTFSANTQVPSYLRDCHEVQQSLLCNFGGISNFFLVHRLSYKPSNLAWSISPYAAGQRVK